MRKFIRGFFGLFGLEVHKKRQVKLHYVDEMSQGMERLGTLKYNIKTVVDVGAAQGTWSVAAKNFWPSADFVLFEPLKERKEILDALASSDKTIHIVPFAAGKERSTISFMVKPDDLDGSGVTEGESSNIRTVETTSIQEEVKNLGLKGPFLIKLDTHGFEIPIIEGCVSILSETSIFIIECYGFQIAKNSLLFWELCQYMDKLGFRLFDIIDIMRRSMDQAFWQCDAFFIKKDHPVFQKNNYA